MMLLATLRCFKPALISKGLRLPRQERIEELLQLQASPDFKGIKTRRVQSLQCLSCFKPALISKGLRLAAGGHLGADALLLASPNFKGIKTGQ